MITSGNFLTHIIIFLPNYIASEQLSEDYQHFKEDDTNARRLFLLQKAIHQIIFDPLVQYQWESVVEKLDLSPEFENELKSINSAMERLKKAFNKWIEISGGSTDILLQILKDNNLINASRKFIKIILLFCLNCIY